MYIKKFSDHEVVISNSEKDIVITCDENHEFDYDIIEKIWEDF